MFLLRWQLDLFSLTQKTKSKAVSCHASKCEPLTPTKVCCCLNNVQAGKSTVPPLTSLRGSYTKCPVTRNLQRFCPGVANNQTRKRHFFFFLFTVQAAGNKSPLIFPVTAVDTLSNMWNAYTTQGVRTKTLSGFSRGAVQHDISYSNLNATWPLPFIGFVSQVILFIFCKALKFSFSLKFSVKINFKLIFCL